MHTQKLMRHAFISSHIEIKYSLNQLHIVQHNALRQTSVEEIGVQQKLLYRFPLAQNTEQNIVLNILLKHSNIFIALLLHPDVLS